MIKYRTSGTTNIEKVEVLRETKSQVVFPSNLGNRKERRENKISTWINYFDTWEEAKAHLLKISERKLIRARISLEQANGVHGNIKGLRNPEAK